MPISDLTGTIWEIPASGSFASPLIDDTSFAINATIGGVAYTRLFISNARSIIRTNTFFDNEGGGYYGIVQEAQPVWENLPCTVQITGGTDATNATLIAWFEANAVQQSAPTLAGTIWGINESPNFPETTNTFSINFVANGVSYTGLIIGRIGGSRYLNYNNEAIFNDDNGGWVDDTAYLACRTISISGGADATNADLLAWLQQNAVQLNIADLSNTTWLFNNVPSDHPNIGGSINFTSNSETFIGISQASGRLSYVYTDQTGVMAYAFNTGWANEAYKTISISGGDSVMTPELIQYIEANAVQQSAPSVNPPISIGNLPISKMFFGNLPVSKLYLGQTLLYEDQTPAVTTISFTIDGTPYTADSGMTWAQWVASNYNTDGYIIIEIYVETSANFPVVYNGSDITSTDTIVANASYSIVSGGSND